MTFTVGMLRHPVARVSWNNGGISHRQAVVTQSSAARHRHLMRCFLDALDATHTSLNLITIGIRPPGPLVRLNAWLVAQGWALAYRPESLDYVADEEAARRSGRGLWRGDFEAPWVWRARQ